MKYLIWAAVALSALGSTAVIAQFVTSKHEPQISVAYVNNGASDRQAFNAQPSRNQTWSEGDVLSSADLADRNVVPDWRANHLHRPAEGYRWVRLDDKFALVAMGSDTVTEVARDDRLASADERE